jgi:hypothetical protein
MTMVRLLLRSLRLWPLLLLVLVAASQDSTTDQPLQCSLSDADETAVDPSLKPMTYDVGQGPQTVWVYKEPPVFAMYKGFQSPSRQKVEPKFNGLAGKFINMSNKAVTLYWYVPKRKK